MGSRDASFAQTSHAGAEQGDLSLTRLTALQAVQGCVTNIAWLQVSSACSCERNWSTYDYIHNKRRNCLSSAQCCRLVYYFTNR